MHMGTMADTGMLLFQFRIEFRFLFRSDHTFVYLYLYKKFYWFWSLLLAKHVHSIDFGKWIAFINARLIECACVCVFKLRGHVGTDDKKSKLLNSINGDRLRIRNPFEYWTFIFGLFFLSPSKILHSLDSTRIHNACKVNVNGMEMECGPICQKNRQSLKWLNWILQLKWLYSKLATLIELNLENNRIILKNEKWISKVTAD